ncbi:DUF4870 domain-containing protein [Actinoplanes palleronii]|uniref:DUF4870 domain-containing protein n=1 Tax=Actinoplanes palleronii TaxID=113570 RepID=A0ABQ4B953_9ACTN|nr:DUF4870 domain-containing protein [Actinoplanes palleronii]GIE67125.1 hypothetical protein Apa02nite_032330 [Actinoplanes palleronii]
MDHLREPHVPEPESYPWTPEPVPDDVVPARRMHPARERAWARFAHWGGLFGVLVGALLGWVAPLIVLVVAGRRSAVVRGHAVAALNFYLTWLLLTGLAAVASVYTTKEPELVPFVMIWIPLIIGCCGVILSAQDDGYRYPTAIRFIR